MPGQHGYHQRTEFSKKILSFENDVSKVNPKKGWTNYGLVKGGAIIISGSVPGPKKRLIMLSSPRRNLKYEPSEIRSMIME